MERNRIDEEGGDFANTYLRGIWDGFWWATVTVTTVGYGDKAPQSVRGRLIALLAMLLSLFLVGAFVSQVTDVLRKTRSEAPLTTLDEARGQPVGVVAGSSFATFGVAQDSPWREPINQVLADLQATGEIERIVDRWLD